MSMRCVHPQPAEKQNSDERQREEPCRSARHVPGGSGRTIRQGGRCRDEANDDCKNQSKGEKRRLGEIGRIGEAVDSQRDEASRARRKNCLFCAIGCSESPKPGEGKGNAGSDKAKGAEQAGIVKDVDVTVMGLDVLDRVVAAVCVVEEAISIRAAAQEGPLTKNRPSDRDGIVARRKRRTEKPFGS